jgi:MFS family permease
MSEDGMHRDRTLWLCTGLHAFTHLYHVALIPLYLLIREDFGLTSDGQATFLVTVMGLAYFLLSYPLGVMADRFSRKKLLGLGLAINALGFIGLAFAPTYWMAVLALIVAGIGGSFYHPAATSLVVGLFPVGTGKALGKVGIGAGVGFFLGPIYSGWRAEMADWRTPVLELGLVGLLCAALFMWLAVEHPRRRATPQAHGARERLFGSPVLWILFVGACLAFAMRDFAGSGMASLGSLFLQRAHDFSPGATGLAVSSIFLAAIISNPLFGGLSDRGRIRWIVFVLLVSAGCIYLFPRVPAGWVIPAFAVYGFFFMAGYPMVEAALMESVHGEVRGRVIGLYITISGLLGNLSHWRVGDWVKELGPVANQVSSYYPLYDLLALMVLLSTGGLVCLRLLRKRESEVASEPPLVSGGMKK